jgi:hypothetical protein
MTLTTRSRYITHIKANLDAALASYDEAIEQWRQSIRPDDFFGFNPPALPVHCAEAEAFLYRIEGDLAYARRARERLITYRRFTEYFPAVPAAGRPEYADGLPPIPNFFVTPHYIRAYEGIRDSGILNEEDCRTIEGVVEDSLAYVFRFPEWGAHNRAMLRAAALALAARVFPDNPRADDWAQMARFIAGDTIGRWSIEDASHYHPIWTYALLLYAEATQDAGIFDHVTTRYYFDYYLALLAPSGSIADFGDSHWRSDWSYFLCCFEYAARQYRDPRYRYAACRIYSQFWEEAGRPDRFGSMTHCMDACRWMDESILPETPATGSQEVLEDLAGKKIVFRTGWDDRATFLLLNYKPETDYGYTPREYLKRTICVEAEKAHHGHADENAVSLFMHRGSVLLHDSGYRENLPNGKYRADLYHNRIVVRRGIPHDRTSILAFLDDGGAYKPSETQKIDFIAFSDVEMSRTRVLDRNVGYQWDRTVVHLKQESLFVLFDGVEFLTEGQFTLSSLFYTRDLLGQGPGWFDTRIDEICGYRNPGDQALLVWFAQTVDRWEGTDATRRHYQDERLVHQTLTATYKRGDLVNFCTVLAPHAVGEPAEAMARRFRVPPVDRAPAAAGLEIETASGLVTLGVKLDLNQEILTENIRPRYTYEAGRTVYGRVETDARFVCCRESGDGLAYAFTEGVKLVYRDRTVFAAEPCGWPLQFFGEETQPGISKWRAWEGKGSAEREMGMDTGGRGGR